MILLTQKLEGEQILDSDPRFSVSLLKNIFVTALQDGSNYWLIINNWCLEEHIANITDIEANPFTQYEVDLNVIKKGFEILYAQKSEWSSKKLSNILNKNYDAEDADVILQYGLFGELLYG